MFRGVTPVEHGGVNPDYAVGREECDREVEQDAPNRHIEPIERLTQRTEATATLGGPAFGHTTVRTCNSLRVSTEPVDNQ